MHIQLIQLKETNKQLKRKGAPFEMLLFFMYVCVFFQIKIEEINSKWKGTIILGAVSSYLNNMHLPSSAILLRRPCWIITHDYINFNGSKIQSKLGEALLKIQKDTIITLTLTHSGSLTLTIVNNLAERKASTAYNSSLESQPTIEKFVEEIASGLPQHVYPIFDLYGKCERISLICPDIRNGSPINEEVFTSMVNNETDRNSMPQFEKADLEVHEKETDGLQPSLDGCEGGTNRSIANGTMYAHEKYENQIKHFT